MMRAPVSHSVLHRLRHASLAALRAFAALAALGALTPSRAALAQSTSGFAVLRFEPAERGSAMLVNDTLELRGQGRPAIGATMDYAHEPLVALGPGGVERFAPVRHQLFVHLGASFVLADRVRLGVDVPFAAYQDGEAGAADGVRLVGASAPALGDVRLAGDVRVAGRVGDPIVVAVGARAWLPTGLRSQYTSDGALRAGPHVAAAGELGAFVWAARVALVYRARDDAYAGAPLGSEIGASAGAGVRFAKRRVFVGPEIYASTLLGGGGFLEARTTPADWLLGARIEAVRGLFLGAGAGRGITSAMGSPALRALASLEWAPPYARPDRDRDGIPDDVDACPDRAGLPDEDETSNGCPPPPPLPPEDTDGDGVWDADDACPALRGVRTTDPRTNGCPPAPPPPPPPDRPLVEVTEAEIQIREQVSFATDSAELVGSSDALLSAVKRALDEHPEIKRVRIEGHTDAVGDPAYNDELSTRRAAAVSRWLVDHGVDPQRLESQGFGSRSPVASNDTEEGRAKNRRVVFRIVER